MNDDPKFVRWLTAWEMAWALFPDPDQYQERANAVDTYYATWRRLAHVHGLHQLGPR